MLCTGYAQLLKTLLIVKHPTDDRLFGWVEWSRDGKYILFPRMCPNKDKQQFAVWRIPSEGGKPQELNLVLFYIESLRVGPDGEHLIFDSPGSALRLPATWVMQNFMPPNVTSK